MLTMLIGGEVTSMAIEQDTGNETITEDHIEAKPRDSKLTLSQGMCGSMIIIS